MHKHTRASVKTHSRVQKRLDRPSSPRNIHARSIHLPSRHNKPSRSYWTSVGQSTTNLADIYPTYPPKVKIIEVGPRDGLQNQSEILDPEVKVKFIDMLSETGLTTIEAGSFVSPKWIPQMADTSTVYNQINKKKGISYSVLTPNMQGFENAMACGVKEVAVFAAASEAFSQRNINCSISQSLDRFVPVLEAAKQNNIKVRGYVSCVVGCPYQGEVDPADVARVSQWLYENGCYEVSLGDTIGVGTGTTVHRMLSAVQEVVPTPNLAVHFHDTMGMALSNIHVALQHGITAIDSAAAGLGGCPYARSSSGNLATEDVVYMLNGLGIETGVDLDKLLAASRYITGQLHIRPASKTCRALLQLKKNFANDPIQSEAHQKLIAMTAMPH